MNVHKNTLRKISPDCVIDEHKGFRVELRSEHTVVYSEEKLVMSVEIEGGLNEQGEHDFAVYTETLKAFGSVEKFVAINDEKKAQIIENIGRALTFLGIKHIIV